ncbi:MAG: hypothetical protein IJ174_05295 [Clostridia bacterium]|nr:hypothetical protein [Clostridia bacterium]
MSHPLKKRIFDAVWDFAVTALIAVSLSLLWSLTLTGEGGSGAIILTVTALSAGFSAADQILKGKWLALFFIVIALLLAATYFLKLWPVFEMVQGVKALLLRWQGAPSALTVYAGEVRMLISALMVLLSFTQTRDDAFGTAVFTFVFLAGICFFLRQYTELPVYPFTIREGVLMLLPGCAGLLFILSAGGGRTLRSLPAAALLLALSYFFLPGQGSTTEPFQCAAQEIAGFFQTAVLDVQREGFSLAAAGFGDRNGTLGGQATPGTGKVLYVNGEPGESLYLRGYTQDTYTGSRWDDRLSSGSALFFLESSARNRLFDLRKHFDAQIKEVTVHALADAGSTVFAPQRIVEYQPVTEQMTLYYNEATELFLARNLAQGDEYTVRYIPFSADDESTRALITSLEGTEDPDYATASDRYLNVPGHMPEEVLAIAISAAGQGTPLEKAIRIRDYLLANYTYTLKAEEVSLNEDFVTSFLLSTRKGYCTYFASAMTVLCRMNGIPARYVAGYHSVLNDDGQAEIQQRDAHAWTEIYLNGFGWLTMDATPGDNGGRTAGGWRTPSPSPRPTATPTATPSEQPNGGPSPSPSPSDGTGNTTAPTNTPTPRPSLVPSTRPTQTSGPKQAPRTEEREPSRNLILYLILLLLLILFVLRLVLTDPRRRAKRHPERAGEILMNANIRLLSAMKKRRNPGETWAQFGERLESGGQAHAAEAFDAYSAAIYGKHDVSPQKAEVFYQSLRASASVFAKAKAALIRCFTLKP